MTSVLLWTKKILIIRTWSADVGPVYVSLGLWSLFYLSTDYSRSLSTQISREDRKDSIGLICTYKNREKIKDIDRLTLPIFDNETSLLFQGTFFFTVCAWIWCSVMHRFHFSSLNEFDKNLSKERKTRSKFSLYFYHIFFSHFLYKLYLNLWSKCCPGWPWLCLQI